MSDLINYQTTVLSTISSGAPYPKPVPAVSTEEFKRKSLISFYLYLSLEKLLVEIFAEMEDAISHDYAMSWFMFLSFPITLLFYYILYKKMFVKNLTQGIIKKLKNTFLALPPRILTHDTYLKNAFAVSKQIFNF